MHGNEDIADRISTVDCPVGVHCTKRFILLSDSNAIIDNPKNDCIKYANITTQPRDTFDGQYTGVEVQTVTNYLKSGKFWFSYNIIKSPGDAHCIMHSVVNSLNVCAASGVTIYDVMKQLTDETVRNSYRYIYFIDG